MRRSARVVIVTTAAGVALGSFAGAGAAAGSTVVKSSGFAGYAVTKHAAVQSASATFTVRRTTCSSGRSPVAPAVLLLGPAGIVGGGVGVRCIDGTPVYRTVFVMNGHESNAFEVGPGDVVSVAVVESQSTHRARVSITDAAAGRHRVVTGARHPMNEAQIGEESVVDGGAHQQIDSFGGMHFTACQVNGESLTEAKAFPVERTDGGAVQIAVGPLSGGTSFRATFHHH